MKTVKYIGLIAALMLLIIAGFIGYQYGKAQVKTTIVEKKIKITQKQIDSLTATIKPTENKIVRYKEKRAELQNKEVEITYPKDDCKEIVENLKQQLSNCDSVTIYQDKIIYVDREIIKKQDVIIDLKELPKQKRFGIGVQVGYGLTEKQLSPYIGVGVSYNILRF